MVVVMLRADSKIFHDITLAEQTMSTIMVSPMARPKPSTVAAKTPGSAAGRTTCQAACHLDDPDANRGNARKQFDRRLDDLAEPGPGHLGDVNGRRHGEWNGEEQPNQRRLQ